RRGQSPARRRRSPEQVRLQRLEPVRARRQDLGRQRQHRRQLGGQAGRRVESGHHHEGKDEALAELAMSADLDLPLDAVLGIWSELEAARLGKNGYGSTVAEIYAYRLIPEGVASTRPSV